VTITRTKQLVVVGISRNGGPFAVRAASRPPADWPTNEEIDGMGRWTWPVPVDARDDAQRTPRQEEYK